MRHLKFVLIGCGLLLSSCNYFLDWTPGDLQTSSGVILSQNSTVDSMTIQQTVLRSCTKCHSGQKSPNLATLDDISRNIKAVLEAVNSNQMPPSFAGYSPLSDCEKNILMDWVASGMPQTSSKKISELSACHQGELQPAPAPPAPQEPASILEMPLNYETLTTQILQPRCLHCHNPDSEDGDAAEILFYPFAEITKNPKLLGTSSLGSRLYKVVSRTDDERMPPPEDSEPLTADQLEFIKRWVDAGHPEK